MMREKYILLNLPWYCS